MNVNYGLVLISGLAAIILLTVTEFFIAAIETVIDAIADYFIEDTSCHISATRCHVPWTALPCTGKKRIICR